MAVVLVVDDVLSRSKNWPLTRHNADPDTLQKMAGLPGRTGDDRILGEQAALRRVATLVARAAVPEDVFAAVTKEAGQLLGAPHAMMSRYDPDSTATVVASWSSSGAAFPVGTCLQPALKTLARGYGLTTDSRSRFDQPEAARRAEPDPAAPG